MFSDGPVRQYLPSTPQLTPTDATCGWVVVQPAEGCAPASRRAAHGLGDGRDGRGDARALLLLAHIEVILPTIAVAADVEARGADRGAGA